MPHSFVPDASCSNGKRLLFKKRKHSHFNGHTSLGVEPTSEYGLYLPPGPSQGGGISCAGWARGCAGRGRALSVAGV